MSDEDHGEIDQLRQELEDSQRSFDLRWAADQRAIQRWQAAHPDRSHVWPDHADLCVWLLEQLEAARQQSEHLQRCEQIVKKIQEICDNTEDENGIQFTPDWGGYSLTIELSHLGHTHVGYPELADEPNGWDCFVEQLHGTLCAGSGLSWHPHTPPEVSQPPTDAPTATGGDHGPATQH